MRITRDPVKQRRESKCLVGNVPLHFKKDGCANNVQWLEGDEMEIIASGVLVEDGNTMHNYVVGVTLTDFASLIELLAHEASRTDTNALALRNSLQDHVPALAKLLACATGVNQTGG